MNNVLSFPHAQGSHCLPYSTYGENILFPTLKTLFTEIWKPRIFQKKLPKGTIDVSDELHLRPMQGRRKRHSGAGWRSRGTRSGGGSRTASIRSLSPQISPSNVSQHLSFELRSGCKPVSCSDCPKRWWWKAESQWGATQFRDESGPQGISVCCSSPATEGFLVASTLIGLDASYSHVKSPVPWLGVSFWEGKRKEVMKNNHGSK